MLFISYARTDGTAVAERLYREFLLRGIHAWRDTRSIDPYTDFSVEIERAIRSSSFVILCLTPSIATRFDSFARREIVYAQQQRIPIIPFLANGAGPTDVPVTISHITWIDGNDFSQGLAQLLQRTRQPPEIAVPAKQEFDPWRHHLLQLLGYVVNEIDLMTLDPDALIPLRLQHPDEPLAIHSPAYTPRSYPWIRSGPQPLSPGYSVLSEALLDRPQGVTVLLGEPGSGKTTSILALAREMAVARLSDSRARIPIFAPLRLWNGQEGVIDWLARVTGLTAEQIDDTVSTGYAVILLDGLDEVSSAEGGPGGPEGFLRSWVHLQSPALITCRTDEFRYLSHTGKVPADFRQVIVLAPLSDREIKQFLEHDSELVALLDEDSELLELVRTPIFLVVLAIGYRELPQSATSLKTMDSLGDIRDELFHRYFRRLYDFEAAHTDHELPVMLEDVYSRLGKTLLALRGSAFQVFWSDDYLELPFELDPDVLTLIVRLRIIAVGPDGRYRFRHILVHHHFAFSYAASQITSSQRHVRRAAARALGWIGDPRGTPFLRSALDDEPSVQHMAIESLGRVSTPEAILTLLNLASGPNGELRSHAEHSIGQYVTSIKMCDKLAIGLRSDSWQLRLGCAEALARAGDSRAIPVLIEALSTDSRDAEVAANALAAILEVTPTSEALEPLISATINGPSYVQIHAVRALGALGDERARSVLLALANDDELELKEAARLAISRLGRSRA